MGSSKGECSPLLVVGLRDRRARCASRQCRLCQATLGHGAERVDDDREHQRWEPDELTRCRCSVCVAARDGTQLSQAVVALVTDRADTVRVTFATGADPTTVFHHEYQLRGPHLDAFSKRVFMLDPPNGTFVLSLDALKHGQLIARQSIAGLE